MCRTSSEEDHEYRNYENCNVETRDSNHKRAFEFWAKSPTKASKIYIGPSPWSHKYKTATKVGFWILGICISSRSPLLDYNCLLDRIYFLVRHLPHLQFILLRCLATSISLLVFFLCTLLDLYYNNNVMNAWVFYTQSI